ncbi:hypothetical protein [Candidatus Nanohalococcus occultus]|uniref:Uncharacterized protein n=1 Tax=Candidatus Nanohalococcus occultus TaxID=2978047 RepID=A0ABY8CGR1_9ARCH|nr:hypothetical protein SVXNc_0086 [Candidatus Nanohaloarchaeota archaeon SVXNc]
MKIENVCKSLEDLKFSSSVMFLADERDNEETAVYYGAQAEVSYGELVELLDTDYEDLPAVSEYPDETTNFALECENEHFSAVSNSSNASKEEILEEARRTVLEYERLKWISNVPPVSNSFKWEDDIYRPGSYSLTESEVDHEVADERFNS